MSYFRRFLILSHVISVVEPFMTRDRVRVSFCSKPSLLVWKQNVKLHWGWIFWLASTFNKCH